MPPPPSPPPPPWCGLRPHYTLKGRKDDDRGRNGRELPLFEAEVAFEVWEAGAEVTLEFESPFRVVSCWYICPNLDVRRAQIWTGHVRRAQMPCPSCVRLGYPSSAHGALGARNRFAKQTLYSPTSSSFELQVGSTVDAISTQSPPVPPSLLSSAHRLRWPPANPIRTALGFNKIPSRRRAGLRAAARAVPCALPLAHLRDRPRRIWRRRR